MKLIIDIDDKLYYRIKNHDVKVVDNIPMASTINNGTPLQAELEEISREVNSLNHHYDEQGRYCLIANDVFKILDNHIKELEEK